MATIRFEYLVSQWPALVNFGRLGAVALTTIILSACVQSAPMPTTIVPATSAPVSAPTAEATVPLLAGEIGDTLAGMKQFADAENNFAFYIPAEWDVFGPDHNAIGSQFIMGPVGTGWISGEPAAVQISVIDSETMTIGEALEMLCAGCEPMPVPQPFTLPNGLSVLRAVADLPGATPVEFYIIEFGPKVIIFVIDQAKAGKDVDKLLGTFGPLDGTKPAGENTGRYLYEGISFALPESLARWVSGESVAADESSADSPWWVPVPKHPEIKLVWYPVEGSAQAPRIMVYPVHEFALTNVEAANQIELLRHLLLQQVNEPGMKLPFLPLINAGAQMHARVKYISFQGGQGVRYLTQYGQGPMPINNQELFYTFQGLTDDGAHYVVVILPLTHASLPDSIDSPPEAERQALYEDFEQYIGDTVKALETQADGSFKPSLAELDALVQSLNVMP